MLSLSLYVKNFKTFDRNLIRVTFDIIQSRLFQI